jgi:uncharacterized protein (TIGR00297 family)
MMALAEWRAWPPQPTVGRILLACAVTVVFASLARALRGVTVRGALAGSVVCFLLCASAGFGAFAGLVTVFVLAWVTTRLGYRRKQHLGLEERREGRSASQVFANLGMAALCAALYSVHGRELWLLACAAALAEASADTVASEVGQATGRQARLITTWEPVAPGTDGGVTLPGTVAGGLSAALVSLVCAATGVIAWKWCGVSVAAAMAGMLGDSFLGAWLERRGLLNNDAVNFLGTAIASASALGTAYLSSG